MYFALDPHDTAALTPSLRLAFNSTDDDGTKNTQTTYLALMDSAFDYGQKSLSWHSESLSVYRSSARLAALDKAAPRLLLLSAPDMPEFETEIKRLSRHCNGRPMLSFLQCKVSAEELSEQWQKCLMLKTQDDSEPYLLRLADTRVLPGLATMPDTPIWQMLTQSLLQWLTVGRTGAIHALPVSTHALPILLDDDKTDDEAADRTITDNDLHHLLVQGQPDSVINVMAEQFPDLMPTGERAIFYERIAQACKLAEQMGIETFPDVLALAMASHLTQGHILKNGEVITVLQDRRWTSGQLSEALAPYFNEEVL